MKRFGGLLLALSLTGCETMMGKDALRLSGADEIAASERMALESQTQARLSVLERSINEYIQAKGEVPEKLDLLIPDYIAEIPDTATGIKECRDGADISYYKPAVIVDGVIDGSKLDGRGGWGYVYNDERVIIFVNCTRKSISGALWYNVRGVY